MTLESYMSAKVKKLKKVGARFKDEEFLLKVGKKMEALMEKKGITHEVFYNDTSINPHRLIVGKINMTLSTLSRICKYLEVSPKDFFREFD